MIKPRLFPRWGLFAEASQHEKRNIRRLMAFTALFGVVNGGVLTFLPVLLARLGASAITVSLLTALPALLTIGFALPAGEIVARWRDMVRSSALCFYALRLSYPLIALAILLPPSVAPYVIVILWALTAIPGTLGNTAFYDVLAGAVSPQRRASINGIRWALLGLVSAGSVSAFGQLLVRLPWPHNYFVLFGICFAAGWLNTWFYSHLEVPPREVPPREMRQESLKERFSRLVEPLRARTGFGTLSLVTLVLRLGIFLPSGLFSIFFVRTLQVSDAWIGMRTTLEQGALTIGYFFWGRMANRLGFRTIFSIAGMALGVALALFSFGTPTYLWPVFIAAALGGFSASALEISLFEWLLAVMPPEDRPRYVAMNTLLMNLVAFGAPILGGMLAEYLGVRAVFRISAVCFELSVLLNWYFSYRHKRALLAEQVPVSASQGTD